MGQVTVSTGLHNDECGAALREFLDRIAGLFADRLGSRLSGIRLRGSRAFGCFRPACSDLDLLVADDGPLDDPEAESARAAPGRVPPPHRDLGRRALDAHLDLRRLLPAERRTAGLEWDETALVRFREWAEAEVARLNG